MVATITGGGKKVNDGRGKRLPGEACGRTLRVCYTFPMDVHAFGRTWRFSPWKGFLWLLLVAVVVALGAFFRLTYQYYAAIKRGDNDPILQRKLESTWAGMQANTKVTPGDLARLAQDDAPSQGPKSAPLTIVEFVDFNCPYCQATYKPVREALARHPNDVRFIVRQFPVEELHPGATQAAVASRCAMKQGKFWPYFDRLFQQPSARTDEDYLRHARDVGLDVAAFQACQADTSVAAGVDQDLADGLAAGVEGTPTFFFNGVRVQGALDAQTIDFLIAKNLRSNP